jgi:hypothetical protein
MNDQTNKETQTALCGWKEERKQAHFQLRWWSSHILMKLVVAHLLEVSPILYGTGSLIPLSTRARHYILIRASSILSTTSHTCIMKICLNILQFMTVSPKCSVFIMFSQLQFCVYFSCPSCMLHVTPIFSSLWCHCCPLLSFCSNSSRFHAHHFTTLFLLWSLIKGVQNLQKRQVVYVSIGGQKGLRPNWFSATITFLKVLHVVNKCLRVTVNKFVSWMWAEGGRKGVTSLSQNNGT